MIIAKQKAVASTTAKKNNSQNESYRNCPNKSSVERQEKTVGRRAQIPRLYRSIYDKAVEGNSRKAAMHAFCLECCGWQIKEVFLCTDLGCPLYPYRPKPRSSQSVPESVSNEPESKNSGQGISDRGVHRGR